MNQRNRSLGYVMRENPVVEKYKTINRLLISKIIEEIQF